MKRFCDGSKVSKWYPGMACEKIIARLPAIPHLFLFQSFVTSRILPPFPAVFSFSGQRANEGERNNLFANQSWQRVAYISNVHHIVYMGLGWELGWDLELRGRHVFRLAF